MTESVALQGDASHARIPYSSRTLPSSNRTATLPKVPEPHDADEDQPGPAGYDSRTFECAKCNHALAVIVAHDPMKSGRNGWIAGELKPPDACVIRGLVKRDLHLRLLLLLEYPLADRGDLA